MTTPARVHFLHLIAAGEVWQDMNRLRFQTPLDHDVCDEDNDLLLHMEDDGLLVLGGWDRHGRAVRRQVKPSAFAEQWLARNEQESQR
jgi:hypothetical protein